jgi:hypothetical protein
MEKGWGTRSDREMESSGIDSDETTIRNDIEHALG